MSPDSIHKNSAFANCRPLDWRGTASILAATSLAYASNLYPGRLLLKWGLEQLGEPPYAGFAGAFVPHLLLYSTFMAAITALFWAVLARAGFLPGPKFGNVVLSVRLGIAGALAALVLTLAVVWLTMPHGTIHWIAPQPWSIAGNIFSNFYEEFVFRGFILVALRRLFGFWPAALGSAALWALLHFQFPAVLQAVIFVIGVGFAWLAGRANSLWAPYFAHEILDLLADSLMG